MGKKRTPAMQAAAAELVAAAAAAEAGGDEVDLEAEEMTQDVLDGLRRLDQGGNRVTWYVYCDAPIEREGFIEKLRTEQLDEQRFKGKYGPGEYRVQGRAKDGGYVKGSHKIIKISNILADDTRAAAPGNDAMTLLREMRAQDEARSAKRSEELKTYATILSAPLATLGAALIARRPAVDVAALIAALRPQQSSLAEMTTALTHLKAMQGDNSGGGVEIVLKVLEKLQDLPQAGGGGELGWLGFIRDVIKDAAPHARELLGQLAQNRQQTPGALPPGSTTGPAFGPGVAAQLPQPQPPGNGATPPPPSPSPASSVSPSAPSGDGETAVWQIAEPWLRRRADELLEDAATNMDTQLCAEVLLSKARKRFGALVPPAQLLPLLNDPQWWEHVIAFAPALAPYQAWVDDVRCELVMMIEDELRGESAGADATPERDS